MIKRLLILILFLSSVTAFSQTDTAEVDPGYPVIVYSDTLFFVKNDLGSKRAEERAKDIGRKAELIINDFSFDSNNFTLEKKKTNTIARYEDIILFAVNDEDAEADTTTQEELASEWFNTLTNKIKLENQGRSLTSILINAGIAIVIIIALLFFLKYVNRLFRYLSIKMESFKGVFIRDIKIKELKLLDADNVIKFARMTLKVIKVIFIIFSLYFILPVILSLFPWTEGLADTLFGYVLNPLKAIVFAFINYLPNLITIIVIFVVTRYVIKFLRFISREIKDENLTVPGFFPEWSKPTFNIIRFLVYTFMVIIIFPYLPSSDSDIFKGVSIFLGVLVSLGSSTAIANIVSGLVITYMRPYKIGDRVTIDNVTGDVIGKSLLVTRIRTIKNEDITVPNSKVLSNHSTNYTSSSEELGLILHTTVTIGYDVDWRKVHELLIAAAKEVKETENEKEPFVLQTALNDFYVSYQLNAYTKNSHSMAIIYSEIHQKIQDKFNEAGVEILSPNYISARDGNKMAIPNDYIPQEYTTPSFRVEKTDKKDQ